MVWINFEADRFTWEILVEARRGSAALWMNYGEIQMTPRRITPLLCLNKLNLFKSSWGVIFFRGRCMRLSGLVWDCLVHVRYWIRQGCSQEYSWGKQQNSLVIISSTNIVRLSFGNKKIVYQAHQAAAYCGSRQGHYN